MTTILQNITFFLLANVAARAFGVVKSFWLARILDPADYGIWVFLLLIVSYAPILTLGTMETMVKRVPFLRGKGDLLSVQEVEGGVFSFMVLISLFFIFCAVVSPFLLRGVSYKQFALPVELMLLSVAVSLFSAVYYYRLQAYQMFGFVSAIASARSVLVLILQISMSYFLGLTGAFLGFLLSEVLVLVISLVINSRLPTRILLRFRFSLYVSLIKTGMPITMVWAVYLIQTTVDRIVSMSMLGAAQTGYYGIGMSIGATFLFLPDAINQVLYLSVNEEYGRTADCRELIPLVVDPARIMSLFLPFVAYISVVVLPLIFTIILPKYMPGLAVAQILIISALYSGITRGGTNLLISTDKLGLLLVLIGGSVVTNLCGSIILVKLRLGIVGIALSTGISSALLAFSIWFCVFRAVGFNTKASILSTLDLFVPALLFSSLAFIDRVVFNSVYVLSARFFITMAVELVLYWLVLLVVPHYRKLIVRTIRQAGVAATTRLQRIGKRVPVSDGAAGSVREHRLP